MRAAQARHPAAVAAILVSFASQKGFAGEVYQLIRLNSGPDWDIEHHVSIIRYVGGNVADDSVTETNEHREADPFFSGRPRSYGILYFFNSVSPTLPINVRIAWEEKLTQCNGARAQLIFEAPLGVCKIFAIVFREVAFEIDPNAGSWRMTEIFSCRLDAKNNAVFHEFCGMREFNILNGNPCPAASNRNLPVEIVRSFGGGDRGFHVARLNERCDQQSDSGDAQNGSCVKKALGEKSKLASVFGKIGVCFGFIAPLLSFLGAIGICFCGWGNIYNDRWLLGLGLLLAAFGFGNLGWWLLYPELIPV
ncbi:MAG: hypothetical protein ACREDM_00880 [Methylocella sp.]